MTFWLDREKKKHNTEPAGQLGPDIIIMQLPHTAVSNGKRQQSSVACNGYDFVSWHLANDKCSRRLLAIRRSAAKPGKKRQSQVRALGAQDKGEGAGGECETSSLNIHTYVYRET